MLLEGLSPGMEHAEESDIRSQVLGIVSQFEHRRGTGAVEQIVEQPGMSLTERVQCVRQSKDDVEVGHRKQVLLTVGKPALTRLGLALRAVAVAARVI